ncbi:MAG TPA: hypothetical protein VK699_03385 [Terriglobales bacterium]|nr:hypothetical protein [Terriglobales bacterium]
MAFVHALVLVALLTVATMLPFPITVIQQYRHFSQVQKYWFPTYLRAEFSPRGGGVYRVLVVEDANKEQWIANAESVLPGTTHTAEGETVPFVLAPKEEQEGKRLVLLPPVFQDNAYLWDSLRNEVYSGKSIAEIGERGVTIGVWLTFITYLAVGVGCLFYWTNRVLNFCFSPIGNLGREPTCKRGKESQSQTQGQMRWH